MAKIKFSIDQAKELRSQGLTYLEISEVMGCSVEWVNKNIVGTPKGNQRVAVNDTKMKAIKILEDALEQMKGLQ